MAATGNSAAAKTGMGEAILRAVIPLIYARRALSFAVLAVLTLLLGWQATQLKPDAGFEKQIPLAHPYMKVFKEYEQAFGGANLISVVLMKKDGVVQGIVTRFDVLEYLMHR